MAVGLVTPEKGEPVMTVKAPVVGFIEYPDTSLDAPFATYTLAVAPGDSSPPSPPPLLGHAASSTSIGSVSHDSDRAFIWTPLGCNSMRESGSPIARGNTRTN